jgi:hypothetical protein
MFSRHVIKELSSYLDNQLSEAKKLKIEKHLKTCELCSQELTRLKLLSEKLKAWLPSEPMVNFESSVRNKIVAWELERGAVKMKKKTLIILIPSGVLAGILVFLFVGQTYIRRGVKGKMRTTSDNIGDQYEPYYAAGGAVAGGLDKKASVYARHFSRFAGATRNQTLGFEDSSSDRLSARPLEEKPTTPKAEMPVEDSRVIVIQPILPATGEGERIIRIAQVRLEVEDGKDAYKKANEICKELGGYLASSNFYKDREGREAGTITMRIPKDKFLTALDRLGELGKVENSSTDSRDVAQEYANLKSRLDAAMVVYNKMLEALQKRQVTIPEAVRLESELTPVLRRIEDLKNQIEYLNNQVSFTTVTVNFHESKVSANVLKQAKEDISQSIMTAKINAVKLFAKTIQNLPGIILFVIWVALIVAAAFLVKYWIARLFKRG